MTASAFRAVILSAFARRICQGPGWGVLRNAPDFQSVRSMQLQLRSSIGMKNTLWKCEQVRAGQITNRVVFDSENQAKHFVREMRQAEPDIFWRIEPVEARVVWN